MIEVIARAAANPNIDVEKMERLLAMQERILKQQAEQEFNADMGLCQAEMPVVVKEGRNPMTNSTFAKFEHINEIAKPIYSKYGISLLFSEGEAPQGSNKIRILCEVKHRGGYSTVKHIDLSPDDIGAKGNASKTKIHGEGSTFTYGRRYLTVLVFNVSLVNEDDDGNHGRRLKPPGPSAISGSAPSDSKSLVREVWALLEPVRGEERNWKVANQWLVDEAITTDTEFMPDIPPERLRVIIEKIKAKLGR